MWMFTRIHKSEITGKHSEKRKKATTNWKVKEYWISKYKLRWGPVSTFSLSGGWRWFAHLSPLVTPLLLNVDILTSNAARYWLLIVVSHAVLYCMKSSMSGEAVLPTLRILVTCMGRCLCGLERVKPFVKVYLHCMPLRIRRNPSVHLRNIPMFEKSSKILKNFWKV